jgi:predicted protein tyrosine phosphatase
MNILFICTSNKDRSPALEKYFAERYPHHAYRSAGVNKYLTGKNGTHYLTHEDIAWAHILVFAETIHFEIAQRDFGNAIKQKARTCMNLGTYERGNINAAYLQEAESHLRQLVSLYV